MHYLWNIFNLFRIAICDDEDILINELKEALERYAVETGSELCFFGYHDGSELLEKYNAEYDLIFMDIKMEHERKGGTRQGKEH